MDENFENSICVNAFHFGEFDAVAAVILEIAWSIVPVKAAYQSRLPQFNMNITIGQRKGRECRNIIKDLEASAR
jgi:hypothetical protein